MFIELVELLRCIRAHDESWLVASIDELKERSIHRGRLGCPICQAEYPVVGGVADFSGAMVSPAIAATARDSDDAALKAGAFLGLAESTGTVLLGGSWAAGASALQSIADARVFVLNAAGYGTNPAIGRILVDKLLPFAAASCAGVALDNTFHAALLESAIRIVRPGGRIVGPPAMTRPAAFTLLAEDAEWWVAEKPPEVTTLRRGNR